MAELNNDIELGNNHFFDLDDKKLTIKKYRECYDKLSKDIQKVMI